MNNIIGRTFLIAFLLLSQIISSQDSHKKITSFVEYSKTISSVGYKIHQKNAKGRYGRPVINAEIYQLKADVKNIGFGNALP